MGTSLHVVDIVILCAFILFIVLWALKNRKNASAGDYFLAGKSMSWPVIGLSLFAVSISSSTLVGHAGEAFISGVVVHNYNWISVLVMVFFATFFLPFYLKNGIYTIPEYLERRFDGRSRTYFSFITILGNVFLDAAACLYTGAIVVQMIFPGANMLWIIVIMAVIAGSYTIVGGLSSAIKADMIQAVVLIVGAIALSICCIGEIGGWGDFIARFHDGPWLKMTRPLDDPTVPWLGMIVGIPILGFYFWGNNQVMVQRVLSARSIDHGRKGVLLTGLLTLACLYIIIMPGLVGRGLDMFGVELPREIVSGSELKQTWGIKTDSVYASLIIKYLPTGLIGILLAAMISALTSTLSATLNSVSTLFTMDFYSKWARNRDSKHLVRVGQITALAALVIAVAWAPLIAQFNSLVAYYQEIVSYLAPPIVGTFFVGLFWKRSNARGAFTGLIAGFVVGALIMTLKYGAGVTIPLHFLLLAPILLALSVTVNVAVSLSTSPPPAEKVEPNTWTRKYWTEESASYRGVPWYSNYRVLAALLVAACLVQYLFFF
ncbi:sodium/glucose cotransporter 2 [Bacteroidia bacterium]|nr:sodium/glucose cotransporter 2 [Bacteroidia bacterium]